MMLDNDVFIAGRHILFNSSTTNHGKSGKLQAIFHSVNSFFWLNAQQNAWAPKTQMLCARIKPFLIYCDG